MKAPPVLRDRIVLGLVAAGVLVRALQTFPLRLWGADADSLGTGIVGLHVLAGKWPVFYNAARLGAFESYVHALSFVILGVSRNATAVAPILAATLFLAAAAALMDSLLGRGAALASLAVLAIGSPALIFWTYQPNGWGFTMLFITVALLAAEKIVRNGPSSGWFFALGLSSGLGWWNCLISVSGILAAGGWVLLGQPSSLRRARFLIPAALGFALGAAPWLAFNAGSGWPSLTQNGHVRSVGKRQAVENLRYLLTYSFPELAAAPDPEDGLNPPSAVQRTLIVPTGIVYLAGFVTAVAAAAGLHSRRARGSARPFPTLLLILGVVTVALNVFSEAGGNRGLTVRYVLPAALLAAGGVGLLFEWLRERSRVLAFVAVGIVLSFNVSGLYVPGTSFRRRLERDNASETAVLRLLAARNVDVVWGDYWLVYPINFLTREGTRGIPVQSEADLYGYSKQLPQTPIHWALYARRRDDLDSWASRAGFSGEIVAPAPDRFVFLPADDAASRLSASSLHGVLMRAFSPQGS